MSPVAPGAPNPPAIASLPELSKFLRNDARGCVPAGVKSSLSWVCGFAAMAAASGVVGSIVWLTPAGALTLSPERLADLQQQASVNSAGENWRGDPDRGEFGSRNAASPVPSSLAGIVAAPSDDNSSVLSAPRFSEPSGPRVVEVDNAARTAKEIMKDFNPLSRKLSENVHPDLLAVAALARKISGIDFEVVPGTGGRRDLATQKKIVASGASPTFHSLHILGKALDLIPMLNGVPNFFDPKGTRKIYEAMGTAAGILGVPLVRGWNFPSPDPDHFQLDRKDEAYKQAYDPNLPRQMLYAAAVVEAAQAEVRLASMEARPKVVHASIEGEVLGAAMVNAAPSDVAEGPPGGDADEGDVEEGMGY